MILQYSPPRWLQSDEEVYFRPFCPFLSPSSLRCSIADQLHMSGSIHAVQTKGVRSEDVLSYCQLAWQGVGLHCFTTVLSKIARLLCRTECISKSHCLNKPPL